MREVPNAWAYPNPAGPPGQRRFSGGERKRNELLQLALLRPRLALLDEIDSGLDVDGVRAVLALVQQLRAQGTAFIVVSHYLQLIEQLQPDAVLRLDQGCIAQSGGLEPARDRPHRLLAPGAAALERAHRSSGTPWRPGAMDSPADRLAARHHLHAGLDCAARRTFPPPSTTRAARPGIGPRPMPGACEAPTCPAQAGCCSPWGRQPPPGGCALARCTDSPAQALFARSSRRQTMPPPFAWAHRAPVPPGSAPAHRCRRAGSGSGLRQMVSSAPPAAHTVPCFAGADAPMACAALIESHDRDQHLRQPGCRTCAPTSTWARKAHCAPCAGATERPIRCVMVHARLARRVPQALDAAGASTIPAAARCWTCRPHARAALPPCCRPTRVLEQQVHTRLDAAHTAAHRSAGPWPQATSAHVGGQRAQIAQPPRRPRSQRQR